MAALARASHSSNITQAPGPLATAIPTLTARVHTGPKSIWVCILDAGDVHTEGVLCACVRACGGSFCPRPLLSALSKRQAMAPGASHSTSAASSNQGEQGAAQP